MARVRALYYSSYGHIETMAQAVDEGAREADAQVELRRVPERVPESVARASHYKLDQAAPVATVDALWAATRSSSVAARASVAWPSQMANFLDRCGGLWATGALNGKVAGAFTSTATQHGGQATTLFSILTNLLHFGMVCVICPAASPGR